MNKLKNISLETDRLLLRLPQMTDASEIQRLAGAWEVAVNTYLIPHPYEDGIAENWIESVLNRPHDTPYYSFVIIRREDQQLIGGCGFQLYPQRELAKIGYWIGVPYWGNGYATEATRRMIKCCFEDFNTNRVQAGYYTTNPASRRVMEKAGMVFEGIHRQTVIHEIPAKNYRVYHDLGYCAILREDWEQQE